MSEGCSRIRSRAAQFPLTAGTEAALTELLRDHMQNYDSSHGQVTLAPYFPGWASVSSKCRRDGDLSRPFASRVAT